MLIYEHERKLEKNSGRLVVLISTKGREEPSNTHLNVEIRNRSIPSEVRRDTRREGRGRRGGGKQRGRRRVMI